VSALSCHSATSCVFVGKAGIQSDSGSTSDGSNWTTTLVSVAASTQSEVN
jgi:hypothetical protein